MGLLGTVHNGVQVCQPEFPISSYLDPGNTPSSTRVMVLSIQNAINCPIKLTRPLGGHGRFEKGGV